MFLSHGTIFLSGSVGMPGKKTSW